MNFSFDDFLNKGGEAVDLLLRNNNEITDVIVSLEDSLKRFLDIDVVLFEMQGYEDDEQPNVMTIARIFQPRKPLSYKYLMIRNEETNFQQEITKIKRSDDGYPVVVIDGKTHFSCDNQSEFAEALGAVVANSRNHLTLRMFKNSVEEKLKELSNPDGQ